MECLYVSVNKYCYTNFYNLEKLRIWSVQFGPAVRHAEYLTDSHWFLLCVVHLELLLMQYWISEQDRRRGVGRGISPGLLELPHLDTRMSFSYLYFRKRDKVEELCLGTSEHR